MGPINRGSDVSTITHKMSISDDLRPSGDLRTSHDLIALFMSTIHQLSDPLWT